MRAAPTSSIATAPEPDAFPFRRLFGWIVLFTLVTLLLAPGYGGDSQIYHLPNIANILKSGSPIGLSPAHLYRPAAPTTYYMNELAISKPSAYVVLSGTNPIFALRSNPT